LSGLTWNEQPARRLPLIVDHGSGVRVDSVDPQVHTTRTNANCHRQGLRSLGPRTPTSARHQCRRRGLRRYTNPRQSSWQYFVDGLPSDFNIPSVTIADRHDVDHMHRIYFTASSTVFNAARGSPFGLTGCASAFFKSDNLPMNSIDRRPAARIITPGGRASQTQK